MPSRKNNYRVYGVVYPPNGPPIDTGLWETWGGGDGDSDDTPYTEGDGSPFSLGGKQTRDPITIGRRFDASRDVPLHPRLDALRGKAECVFTKQYVDDEENPIGIPKIRRGKLKKVTDPEADKNSSDPSTFELEMGSNATPA